MHRNGDGSAITHSGAFVYSKSQLRERTTEPTKCEPLVRPFTPRPMINTLFYSLGRGNGLIRRGGRTRDGHPITFCGILIPKVDTPLSPPPTRKERGLAYDSYLMSAYAAYGNQNNALKQTLDNKNHFQGLELNKNRRLADNSDDIVCSKSVEQKQRPLLRPFLRP